jgi:hypothetical protein
MSKPVFAAVNHLKAEGKTIDHKIMAENES